MVATTLQELVENPYAAKSYIVILKPYDTVAAATETIYLSDRGYVSSPTESPANTYFDPRVIEALNFQRSMFTTGKLGGRSFPSFGEIVLANADGGLDDFATYAWDDRDVEVKVGEKGANLSQHFTIFKGQSKSVDFDDLIVRVIIRDGQDKFTRTFPPNTYAGTGGNEGSAIMEGSPKPVCLGQVFNISPVLVDESSGVYQVHDGPIESIVAVYENGVATTSFTTDLSNGRFTMTSTVAGNITADVKGAKPGGSYKETAGDIMRFVVSEYGGLTDPGDLDTASFTALNTANSATVGCYYKQRAEILSVLDELANSIGAFYGFDRSGLFSVGRIEVATGSADLELDSTNIITLERLPTEVPTSTVVLSYKRNFTVFDENTLGASAADRDFFLRESAQVTDEDTAVAAIYPNAKFLEVDSKLIDSSAANTESARLLTLYKSQRNIYRIRCKAQPFTIKLNDVVKITFARYDLTAGKLFRVISLFEDAAINEVELELWG